MGRIYLYSTLKTVTDTPITVLVVSTRSGTQLGVVVEEAERKRLRLWGGSLLCVVGSPMRLVEGGPVRLQYI